MKLFATTRAERYALGWLFGVFLFASSLLWFWRSLY
jgi:hypothetical protein